METAEDASPEREILLRGEQFVLLTHTDGNNVDIALETESSDESTEEEINEIDYYIPQNIRRLTSYAEMWSQLLQASLAMSILVAYSVYKDFCCLPEMVSTVLGGFLFAFSVHCLVSVSYKLYERRLILNMMETMTAAFEEGSVATGRGYRRVSHLTEIIITVFCSLYQISACCIYLMFMVTNVKSMVDKRYNVNLPFRVYMMYFYVFAFLIILVKNLKVLAPLTSNSAILTNISVFSVFTIFVWDPLTSHKPFGDEDGVSLFIVTVFFLMEILNMQSLNMISVLRNDMLMLVRQDERSRETCAILFSISLLFPFLVYFRYMNFNIDDDPVEIVKTVAENKPQNETASVYGVVFQWVYKSVICVLLDYFLCNTIKDMCDLRLQNSRHRTLVKKVLCTAVVFITLLFAVILPNWKSLKPLISTLCVSTSGVALSAVFYCLSFGPDLRQNQRRNILYNVNIIRGVLIIVFTVFAYVFDVPTNVSHITDLIYLSV